ncbi:MAG: hypothetical protein Q8N60_02205 [Candidatus Diapherotrites archaeon]|nr:hypothetical protein [Candidatus Diapherotrites archaeon]
MVRVMKEIPSGRMQYGRPGRRPQLKLVSAVPLAGIRVEVRKIIKRLPVNPTTGKAKRSEILKALRAHGFEVRTSPLGIGVRRKGSDESHVFFRSV